VRVYTDPVPMGIPGVVPPNALRIVTMSPISVALFNPPSIFDCGVPVVNDRSLPGYSSSSKLKPHIGWSLYRFTSTVKLSPA